MIGRRGFLTGLIAAPVIVGSQRASVASASLPTEISDYLFSAGADFPMADELAARLSRLMPPQYDDQFARDNERIGDTLLITLPDNYRVTA